MPRQAVKAALRVVPMAAWAGRPMREFHRQPEVVLAVERMGSAIMLVALVEGFAKAQELARAIVLAPEELARLAGVAQKK